MARHRAVRGMNLDDEYDDEDDYYGHSVEDNFCISPGTAAQFTFNRGQHTFGSYMGDEPVEEESEEEECHGDTSPSVTRSQLTDTNKAKLNSCLEEIHNILGEARPDSVYTETVIRHNYNLQAALDELLIQKEAPKPQREPRQNRRNRSQGTRDVPVLKAPPPGDKNKNSVVNAADSVSKVTVTPKKEPIRGFEPVVSSSESPRKELRGVDPVNSSEDRLSEDVSNNCDSLSESINNAGLADIATPSTSSAGLSTPKRDLSDRPPLPKSSSKTKQKIDVKEEYSKRKGEKDLLNLVVIGHVDAGKSTLMGHLLFQLGCVNKKAMHKYEQESKKLGKGSFAYAWVLDETEEERSRGVTMDVAQTRFETPKKTITLLDAPGHKDFIPNMITGAAQADVAILVINATKGEFETGFETGGQTREHALLARSLGVSQIIVAVNKMDTVEWSDTRYSEVVKKIGQFLKQAGFRDSDVSFVPCSGLGGENLTKTVTEPKLASWYKGPTLAEQIDKFKSLDRPIDKPFRLNVSDVFKSVGTGFSIAGRIGAGHVQSGDRVLVLPGNVTASVKTVLMDEVPVPVGFAGDHVTMLLSGMDMANVNLGSVLCDPASPAKFTTRLRAKIVIFNLEVPITKGFPVVFHYQSVNEPAVIKRLLAQLNKSTGEVIKKKPRCLTKNSSAVVELELERVVCLEEYKDFKDLGRFMLRSGGATIAAGMIEEILPVKTKEEQ